MKYKGYIVYSTIGIVVETIVLLILDLINVRNFIPITSNYDWLSYIETITIDFWSIIGVALTLKQTSEIEKKRMKTYIEIKRSESCPKQGLPDVLCSFYNDNIETSDFQSFSFFFNMKNIGEGEEKDICIETFRDEKFDFSQREEERYVLQVIEARNDKNIMFSFFWHNDYLFEINENEYPIKAIWTIIFSDCYDNRYMQNFYIGIELEINKKTMQIKMKEAIIKPTEAAKQITKLEEKRTKNFYKFIDKNYEKYKEEKKK